LLFAQREGSVSGDDLQVEMAKKMSSGFGRRPAETGELDAEVADVSDALQRGGKVLRCGVADGVQLKSNGSGHVLFLS
jgi:hypothetical protein